MTLCLYSDCKCKINWKYEESQISSSFGWILDDLWSLYLPRTLGKWSCQVQFLRNRAGCLFQTAFNNVLSVNLFLHKMPSIYQGFNWKQRLNHHFRFLTIPVNDIMSGVLGIICNLKWWVVAADCLLWGVTAGIGISRPSQISGDSLVLHGYCICKKYFL